MTEHITITINAQLTYEDGDDDQSRDDFDEDRGVDLTIPLDALRRLTPKRLLAILFEGYEDRLKAEGLQIQDSTHFT